MKAVLPGKFVFMLMDSRGLPLDVIQDVLREEDAAFNLKEFVEAAKASQNYSLERLLRLLKEHAPEMPRKWLAVVEEVWHASD